MEQVEGNWLSSKWCVVVRARIAVSKHCRSSQKRQGESAMGISVTCPNGHAFKVKDKYAGKKGLCPYCPGQVAVRVPNLAAAEDLSQVAYRAAAEEHGGKAPSVPSSSSVFDDPIESDASTSGSLIGSSVIRHNIKCRCGERVPMWFARCPKCGEFMQQ